MTEKGISWALAASKIKDSYLEKFSEEILIQKMLQEAFDPGKFYKSMICGEEIEKYGVLEDMERVFTMMKEGVEDFQEGDFCIISTHEEGQLLFLPVEVDMNGAVPEEL
jgi:hypothetical protein